MTLDFLDKVYKDIFNGNIAYLVNASRVIGGAIVSYSIYKGMMQSFSSTGELISKKEGGFSPYMIYRSLFLFMLIIFIPQILSSFDTICAAIEGDVLKHYTDRMPNFFDLSEVKLDLPPANETLAAATLRKLEAILEFLNPMNWLGGSLTYVLDFILKLIDFIIYPIFLAERYFIMGLIKLFAPLMVALSIFEETRKYIYNIFKMYAIYFLVIIPYIFATIFVNDLHDGIINMLYKNPTSVTAALMVVSGGTIKACAMVMVIFIKLKLYKTSLPFMKELIK